MKIVHMETNNRHVKPKAGGYFHTANAQATMLQSPVGRPTTFFGNKPSLAEETFSHEESASEHV